MKLFFKKSFLFLCSFLVIFSLISCSKKSIDIPKDILSKDELAHVLIDIHLAQAFINLNQMNDSSRYSIHEYADYIFKSHNVTKEKYQTSMAFYTDHPELLDEVYQEVINELSKTQSETQQK